MTKATQATKPRATLGESLKLRPADVCATYQISRTTLCAWVKTKPGFPQPVRHSSRHTVYDKAALDRFFTPHEAAQP
jgi:predicted DNA-binding transcriptional regulator AlpA